MQYLTKLWHICLGHISQERKKNIVKDIILPSFSMIFVVVFNVLKESELKLSVRVPLIVGMF